MDDAPQASRALIELENTDVDLDGAPVLRGISWRLSIGEHWGIVGENGSGKSTFLALLAGTRWPAPDRGRRHYDFGGGPERDAIEARRRITLVGPELQDLYVRREWSFAAVDVVLSGVKRTDVPRLAAAPEDRAEATALLAQCGAAHLAARPFLELSRGEQRRVLIARALAFDPVVLLLDEPLAGLDADARRAVGDAIRRAAKRAQIVVTAHARDELPDIVTHVARIDAGRMVEQGPARLSPAPARPAAHGPRRPRPAIPAPPAMPAADLPLIEVRRADVWLGERRVLRGIDWRLGAGEHWLVQGANGAGKSTFLRLLHGQLRPAVGGSIDWPALGSPRSIRALRRDVAWVSPELQAGYRYRTTVRDAIASGFDSSLGLVRALDADERARVDALLEELDLLRLADRLQTELSYGQFRRVLLARALVRRPRVLLLDEPWEGLDGRRIGLLAARLDDYAADGTQIVCATHVDVDADRYTHRLVLEGGAIASAGPVSRRADAAAGPRGN